MPPVAVVAGGVVPPGVVVAVEPPAGVGDVSTVKPNWPVGPASPLGWRTDHATVHAPVGHGVSTATVTVISSALSCGRADVAGRPTDRRCTPR